LVVVYNAHLVQLIIEQRIIKDPQVVDIDPIDQTIQQLQDIIKHPLEQQTP